MQVTQAENLTLRHKQTPCSSPKPVPWTKIMMTNNFKLSSQTPTMSSCPPCGMSRWENPHPPHFKILEGMRHPSPSTIQPLSSCCTFGVWDQIAKSIPCWYWPTTCQLSLHNQQTSRMLPWKWRSQLDHNCPNRQQISNHLPQSSNSLCSIFGSSTLSWTLEALDTIYSKLIPAPNMIMM